MKTVLVTAYDVDPFKGSESGMGWNLIRQIALRNKVIAVTRRNNRSNIENYMQERNIRVDNLAFYYFDLPYVLRFWKRGQRGSSLYFFLWQCLMPIFIKYHRLSFDIAHNLNFHTDWAPSMLWVFKKLFVWGPIGHHHKIPAEYVLRPYGLKAYLKDRAIWLIKLFFWRCDLLLYMTKRKADAVLCMNTSVQTSLRLDKNKVTIFPSVGSESHGKPSETRNDQFTVLSVGRFVPLKGFDIVIKSFQLFFSSLNEDERKKINLIIVGKGPEEVFLRSLAHKIGISGSITFINWVERDKLSNLYLTAKVFFFPSHEGAGMVVAEALSFGLPVLCFDNYGPGEFVDQNCGVKIAYSTYEQSIRDFAGALRNLYLNRNMIDALSAGAIDRFQKVFDWEKKGTFLQKIYNEVA